MTRMLSSRGLRRVRWASLIVATIAVIVGSGVIPIASTGHWRVTSLLLDFVKRRSVALRATTLAAPDLTAPALVALGAAHYESGCRPCHGRPARALPLIPRRMTPHPPDLQRQVGRWRAEELFHIVRDGIKFTGMPAWPYPDRDDEVWAVVAFVRRLPAMDGPSYDRLIGGPAESSCAGCHGAGGQGRGLVPRLAGQRADYLRHALEAYASGARRSGIMGPIAAALSAGDISTYSARFAVTAPEGMRSHPANMLHSVDRGARLAASGAPDRDVPPCAVCHPGGAAATVNPAYPRLAGLAAAYLEQQLQLFAEARRGGGPFAPLMHQAAAGLTADDRRDVSAYYASLP